MTSRWLCSLAVIALTPACGRLRFDDVVVDDAGGLDAEGFDGSHDRPNLAFITPLMRADFGGIEGADGACATEAAAAGLSGEFIALISTSTINAKERLAGSRGWVRTDGTPLADRADDFFLGGHLLAPLDHDANGAGPLANMIVWTGTKADGTYDADSGACAEWTSVAASAMVGLHNRNPPFSIATNLYACSNTGHLYCLEVGHDVAVQPIAGTGRIAFMSTYVPNDLGLAGFDATCRDDASAAGLPGSYLAAVGTSTQSVASRFATSTPWLRVDGMPVTASGAAMFDGSRLLTFIDQKADGTPITDSLFTVPLRTGGAPDVASTVTSTCNDWTSTTGTAEGGMMNTTSFTEFWRSTPNGCNQQMRMLCLQQ